MGWLNQLLALLLAILRVKLTPGIPRNVRLQLSFDPFRKGKTMKDAILSWQATTVGNPTGYRVTWNYNGQEQAVQTVARTAAGDASGYSLDFVMANPSIAVQPGDTIAASIDAFDAVNNLASPPVVMPAVTIPSEPVPPGQPLNVQLVLA